MRFLCKDFKIVSVRVGSRLQNGPEWEYVVWYTAPDGREKRLRDSYHTKRDARNAISSLVKNLNRVLKQHEKA